MAIPPAPSDLVDLARYPIHDLKSERGQALLAHCRAEIAVEGGVNLLGFLRSEATEALAAEARALLPDAYVKQCRRNVYGVPVDPKWSNGHPGRVILEGGTSLQIAYDQIPGASGLRGLYLWETLIDFVAAVLGKTKLYPFGDRFQALNIVYAPDGGSTPWHFDHNAFSVTLLLAEPEAGGIFEYVPYIKSERDEKSVRRASDHRRRLGWGACPSADRRNLHAILRGTCPPSRDAGARVSNEKSRQS